MTPTRTWSRHLPEKDPKIHFTGLGRVLQGFRTRDRLWRFSVQLRSLTPAHGACAPILIFQIFFKFRPYHILFIMKLSTSRKGRTSYRLKNWDYSWNASYFVTLCTAQRHCYFGRIEGEKMCFFPQGAVADVLWREIKNHAKNVELGSYVIMPNHVHGIITLNNDITPAVGTRHVSMLP